MGVFRYLVFIECDYVFCDSCIKVWLKNVGVCFCCRFVLDSVVIEFLKGLFFKVYSFIKVKCVFLCVGCFEVLIIQFIEVYEILCLVRFGKGILCKKVFRSSNFFKELLIIVSVKYVRQKRFKGIIIFLNLFCEEKFEDKGDVLFFFLCQYF